ncbi:hypothetical protein HDU96_004935, partial [Phlyctochytrium bullatum]
MARLPTYKDISDGQDPMDIRTARKAKRENYAVFWGTSNMALEGNHKGDSRSGSELGPGTSINSRAFGMGEICID